MSSSSSPGTSLTSKKSFLPDCWNDDVRMNSLMSAFRSRDVNPLDWSNKMAFWTDLIQSSCEQTGNPIFSLSSLRERFRRKGTVPVGLQMVLENMKSSAKCQPLESYSTQSQGWIAWGFTTFIKTPISWLTGWGQKAPDTEEFVLPEVVKRMASAVLQRHYDSIDNATAVTDVSQLSVIEYSALMKSVKDICSVERAFDLVLAQLQKDNEITITLIDNQHKIVKFRDRSITTKSSCSPSITEVDTGLVRLQKTQQNLERMIESKEQDVENYEQQARLLLRQGQKAKAKTVLKKKMLLSKEIEKSTTSLENIHSLIYQLQNSKSQKQIVDAYKAGVSAFKQNLDTSGMTAGKIDETIDEMHEVFSDQEDIAEAISSAPWASASKMALSDADLEDELNALLAAEAEQSEPIELPSVPSGEIHPPTPGKSTTPAKEAGDRLKELRAQLAQ